MRGRPLALVLFLLLGAVKLPMEQAVSARLKSDHLLTPMVDLGARENMGQMAFAASLGGLRSLVASITYMRAYLAFEDILWAKVDSLFQLATRLQPRDESYWDEASWHMAFNAASSYLHNPDIKPIVRGQLYHQHVQRGIDILLEGLKFNPDSSRMWGRLADIYARRSREPKKAGEAYERAAVEGPAFYKRLAGYQYVQAHDRESWQRGYELLKEAYDQGKKPPSLIDCLKLLEQKLEIPMVLQIPEVSSQDAAEVNRVGPNSQ